MTTRERILMRLKYESVTEKVLLNGIAGSTRVKRDECFDALRQLQAEELVVIISRKPAIAAGGTAIGFRQTRYALTDAGRAAAPERRNVVLGC